MKTSIKGCCHLSKLLTVIIFANHHELSLDDFAELYEESRVSDEKEPGKGTGNSTSMKDTVGNVELKIIRDAITRYGGNKKRVAEELGISRSYLYKRLAELNL